MTWKYCLSHTLCPFPWLLCHVGNIQFQYIRNHFLQDTLAYLVDIWKTHITKWCHLCESALLSIYPYCPHWPTNPSRIENIHPEALALSVDIDISTVPSLTILCEIKLEIIRGYSFLLNPIKLSLIQSTPFSSAREKHFWERIPPPFVWLAHLVFVLWQQ